MEAVLDSVETFNNCLFATLNRIPIDYQVVRRKQYHRSVKVKSKHLIYFKMFPLSILLTVASRQ